MGGETRGDVRMRHLRGTRPFMWCTYACDMLTCACTAHALRMQHACTRALLVHGACVYLSIHTMALGVSLSPRCTALEPTHLPLAWACSFESTRCMKPLTWGGGVG